MMKGFFLSRSLPVPQAGSFAEPRKKDAPLRLAGFTDDAWSERFAGAKLAGWLGALCEREESVDGMVFCVLMTE